MSDRAERRRRLKEREKEAVHFRILGRVEKARECVLELRITKPESSDPLSGRVIRAIIDTGATNSSIRPDIAAEIGLPLIAMAPVSTASTGEKPIMTPVHLGRLWLGQPIVSGVRQLTAMPMKDEMLFGMDALAGGILTVDMVALQWSWELPRKSVR